MLMQRNDDVSHFLRNELTPIPTSLFKENFMRKSGKSKLATLDDKCNRKLLRQKDLVNADGYADNENDMEEEDEKEEEDSDEVLIEQNYPVEEEFEDDPDLLMSTDGSVQRYVIDGGYLLHRIIWEQHCLYSEIISKYQEYVKRCGICTVVFLMATETVLPQRIMNKKGGGRDRQLPQMSLLKCKIVLVASKKDSFLAHPYNKSKFIDLLATALESEVTRCKGDADTSIVSAVLDHCCEGENVVLLAADTDLLIMLLYFWNDLMGHVIMKSECTKRQNN